MNRNSSRIPLLVNKLPLLMLSQVHVVSSNQLNAGPLHRPIKSLRIHEQ